MSAFGALPLEVEAIPYTAMVSSANKCIEGVPGFGFVIARKDELAAAKARCHSLSLDLHAQWAYMDRSEEHTSELQSLMRSSYAVFCCNKKQTPSNTNHT